MSKGSNQRPTDQKKYQENYEAIFGKKSKPLPVKGDTVPSFTR